MTRNIKMNATNEMNLKSLFNQRILFKFFAYSVGYQSPKMSRTGIVDRYLFENILFGRVNHNLVPILPKISKMTQLEGQQGGVYVLDFVAESFKKFKNIFSYPSRFGMIEDGTPITDPVPFRAYQDSSEKYDNHLTDVITNFNQNLSREGRRANRITSIKEYTMAFLDYYIEGESEFIITRSSYILSPMHHPLSSALSLELKKGNSSRDQEKIEFIDLNNFEFYRQAAINAGFTISKNIPWRINADISSPINKDILGIAGMSKREAYSEVFTSYFDEAQDKDLIYLKSMILSGWEELIKRRPEAEPSGGQCKTTRLRSTIKEMDDLLSFEFWIEEYIKIKNKEKRYPLTKNETRLMIDQTKVRSRFYGRLKILSDINGRFNIPFATEGSSFYEELKQEMKESGDFSDLELDNFSEYVKIVVKKSIIERIY